MHGYKEEALQQDLSENTRKSVTVLPFWHKSFFFCKFWDNQQKLFYFFMYDDLCHIESNSLVQKNNSAF